MTRVRQYGTAAVVVLTLGLTLASPSFGQSDCPTDLPLIEAGKLVMSINATIPPTQYIDKDGNYQGMNFEFGEELARRLCLEPVFQNVAFEVQIPGLQTKRWDMINTGLYYNEDRVKIMQLVPYALNTLSLVTPDGNPLNITQTDDLAGKTVGVEIGGVEERRLRELNDETVAKGLPTMNIRVFNTYGDAFLALGAGQLDAVFVADITGTYFQEQGKFSMPITGLYPGSPNSFATIEPELAAAIVDALNSMLEDGTYAAIMDKAGSTKIDTWAGWEGKFQSYYKPE
jgi:polar amino acid transport system substrate-binding protein